MVDHPRARVAANPRPPWVARRVVATLALVAAGAQLTNGVGSVGAQPAPEPGACEQPYRQILVERTNGRGPDADTVVVWPRRGVAYPSRASGSDMDLQRTWLDGGVDTDGDGLADEITGEFVGDEQNVAIRRGDGVVVLTMPDHALGSMEGATVGDLDADGRDELVVLARPVAMAGVDRYFVVPGTTPAGEQVLPDVAVEVEGNGLMGVGEQGGGGGDDVVVRVGDRADAGDPRHRQTWIVSGDELMAAGPGSSAALVPVVEPYEGFPMAVVDVGDPRPAVISGLPRDDSDPSSSIVGLVLNRSGSLARFELSEPFDSQDDGYGWPPRFTRATAVLYAFPRHALHLELSGGDRGGSIRAVWSIDDPCAELPVAGIPGTPETPGGEGPTPAAPASPVRTSPAYTG